MKTIDLAEELIGFKTVSPVEDPEIFEYIKLYLEENGVEAEIHDRNGVKNLTAEIGEGETRVCLNGHLDTVPPGKGWEVTEPCEPVVKDGKLYGRGAADMKAAAAAEINAFLDLYRDPDFEGHATLMLAGDEEIGGENGTGKLVEEYYDDGNGFDYVLIGEPTDMNIQIGTRGVLWLDIILKGEAAHSSRSEIVYNVMDDLPDALKALNNLEMTYEQDNVLPDPTAEVTVVETDDTYNSIPSHVKLGMDIRYVPDQNIDTLMADIERTLCAKDLNFEIKVRSDICQPCKLNSNWFGNVVTDAVEKVRGKTPEQITEGGASDGRFFYKKGTPFIELGMNQELVHQEDEYCEVTELEKLRGIYYRASKKLVRQKLSESNRSSDRLKM